MHFKIALAFTALPFILASPAPAINNNAGYDPTATNQDIAARDDACPAYSLHCTTNIFSIGSCVDKNGGDCSFEANCYCDGTVVNCTGPRAGDEPYCSCY